MDADLAPELRRRGIDAVSVYDVNQCGADDEAVLRSAADQHRVLLTHNIRHFLTLHRRYLSEGRSHAGILVTNERYIGGLITRLVELLDTVPAEDLEDQLRFL